MRPASHREQIPCPRCGVCRHAHTPEHLDHLLCFHGDDAAFDIRPCQLEHRPEWSDISRRLDDRPLWLLQEDGNGDYDKIWAGRVVDDTDVCDHFEPKVQP